MSGIISRAVRFDSYGNREVLQVVDVPVPTPAAGEVTVQVRAAGINPGEAAIRTGALKDIFPSTFPSGQGSDLAGVVTAVGADVHDFTVGDEVLGYSWTRSSHATYATVPETQLISKPTELDWVTAGSLYVVGCTAWSAVNAVDPQANQTVVVSAAAGGVGTVVLQLLKLRGVRVIGIASPASAETVAALGAVPVAYGDGLAERVVAAAPGGVDRFIDLFGPEYLELAIDLGVPPSHIETIISREAALKIGAKTAGSVDASNREVLTEMANLVASGQITIPIANTYPLEDVRDAFEELERHHTHGKIALIP